MTGGGGRYKIVVLPESRYLPLETLAHAVALAEQGANVVVFGNLAADVSGLADLSRRRDQYRRLLAGISFGSPDARGVVQPASVGARSFVAAISKCC